MPLIVFGSPKGGVGKTSVAANVAASLAQLGLRTLTLDLDPQNALRLHFGVALQDGAGFAGALSGATPGVPLTAFVRQTQWGVGLLPFGQVDTAAAAAVADTLARSPEAFTGFLQQMLADPGLMVVIDTPPGPSSALTAILPYTDLLVCVLLTDAVSAALLPSVEAGRAFGPGTQHGADGGRLRYVLNQFEPYSRLSRSTAEALRPYLGPRLLGEIRRDEMVAEAAAGQCPLPYFAPHSLAAGDIAQIARQIAGGFAPGWGAA